LFIRDALNFAIHPAAVVAEIVADRRFSDIPAVPKSLTANLTTRSMKRRPEQALCIAFAGGRDNSATE
jgi:hypothetical protein